MGPSPGPDALQHMDAENAERAIFDSMDRVDKRDKQDYIVSMTSNDKFRKNFDKINWGGELNGNQITR